MTTNLAHELAPDRAPDDAANVVLEVRDLHVCYRRFVRRPDTLKERLFNTVLRRDASRANVLHAVNDLTFALRRGEVLGICGSNGSGKSSLLRVLAGIQGATSGTVTVRGRIGGVLNLSGSFHMHNTGRENITLNGLLLGMSPEEVRAKTESIIAFSELGEFIESPLRAYSSGMMLRLGFAIAAHVQSDVVLVDEVLAVGDQHFQDKCIAWMRERVALGASFVVVSHDTTTLMKHCDRLLWLNRGQLQQMGEPATVVRDYLRSFEVSAAEAKR
jgi:lipopolysaccharide transport system ATP-binding protein